MTEGQKEQVCLVGERPISLGSGIDCDIVVEDRTVSRRHAEIRAVPEGLKVRDLGSTNGTHLGSTRVTEAIVPIGAELSVGDSILRVRAQKRTSIEPSSRASFGALRGRSLAMREAFAVLEVASETDATVLLEGESGTGKELAARAVHDHSGRAKSPFVVVDCGALPENAIDSHLFGHIEGAFTGAVKSRRGAFLEADGGTLFLDEIGELPQECQSRLLRALEARTVQALGSDRRTPVDTRVVAATHRDLRKMVDEGTFRLDLYYRIAVVHVMIPPLRHRPEDIRCLIETFYEGRGQNPGEIAGENLRLLQAWSWPGNGRELRNVMERAWVLSGAPNTPFQGLPIETDLENRGSSWFVDTRLPFKDAKSQCVELFERQYLASLLAEHDSIASAAKSAGISRNHLSDLVKRHGLKRVEILE